MSLSCAETQRTIFAHEPLYAGTREDRNFFSALSREVVERIPLAERRRYPCRPGDSGVDIHEAQGSYAGDYNDAYSGRWFSLGEFLFSISQETAKKYLPNHYKGYPQAKSLDVSWWLKSVRHFAKENLRLR